MRLYNNENGSLTCNTVSPLMMQRILQLDEVENDEEAHRLISHIKSIQILTAKDPTAYAQHFEQAKELADSNSKRSRVIAGLTRERFFIACQPSSFGADEKRRSRLQFRNKHYICST